jgi:hypothetical protein
MVKYITRPSKITLRCFSALLDKQPRKNPFVRTCVLELKCSFYPRHLVQCRLAAIKAVANNSAALIPRLFASGIPFPHAFYKITIRHFTRPEAKITG